MVKPRELRKPNSGTRCPTCRCSNTGVPGEDEQEGHQEGNGEEGPCAWLLMFFAHSYNQHTCVQLHFAARITNMNVHTCIHVHGWIHVQSCTYILAYIRESASSDLSIDRWCLRRIFSFDRHRSDQGVSRSALKGLVTRSRRRRPPRRKSSHLRTLHLGPGLWCQWLVDDGHH